VTLKVRGRNCALDRYLSFMYYSGAGSRYSPFLLAYGERCLSSKHHQRNMIQKKISEYFCLRAHLLNAIFGANTYRHYMYTGEGGIEQAG
jgi:hypothetical protein